ncbi:MAG: acylphosphatase [Pseudomonadota bacterium]
MSGARLTVRARVTGRVQGVGFRAWTAEKARDHGLGGWVKNEADGTVTALLSGPGEAVEAVLSACREGPPSAHVDQLTVEPADTPVEPPFQVRR